MNNTAFMFSGQGAQFPKMGKPFYDASKKVQNIYKNAEKINPGIIGLAFESDAETLLDTRNTQPTLYLAALAGAVMLEEYKVIPQALAGFSLGEVPALAYAGVFSYEDGFRIVRKRAELMAECAEKSKAGMVADLNLPDEKVEEICAEFRRVYPVNYNCEGQLVCAVSDDEKTGFIDKVSSAKGKTIPLAVSGGFHSPFMNEAAEKFADFLNGFTFEVPKITVYSNFTAEPYMQNTAKTLLSAQIVNPVRWKNVVKKIGMNGIETFIEVGAGSTLKKLVKKIIPEISAYSVENPEEIVEILKKAGEM